MQYLFLNFIKKMSIHIINWLLFEMKSFAKSEHEKTNRERDVEVFIMKYNDNVQSENITINDKTDKTFLALLKENIFSITANNILPPSNSNTGRRFKVPKNREERMNNSKNSLV